MQILTPDVFQWGVCPGGRGGGGGGYCNTANEAPMVASLLSSSLVLSTYVSFAHKHSAQNKRELLS